MSPGDELDEAIAAVEVELAETRAAIREAAGSRIEALAAELASVQEAIRVCEEANDTAQASLHEAEAQLARARIAVKLAEEEEGEA